LVSYIIRQRNEPVEVSRRRTLTSLEWVIKNQLRQQGKFDDSDDVWY